MKHFKVKNFYDKQDTDFTGSVIDNLGNIAYYVNGKYHREDEPAIEWSDGDKTWVLHGELHRENGPALEFTNGDKEWYLHDKIHRIDGPAKEYANGDKQWYYNHELISDDPNYTLEYFQREIKLRIFK